VLSCPDQLRAEDEKVFKVKFKDEAPPVATFDAAPEPKKSLPRFERLKLGASRKFFSPPRNCWFVDCKSRNLYPLNSLNKFQENTLLKFPELSSVEN
jgi:hypothetical protein|tara:strand:+ start:142 stop:432 length:291 start_codon:yes stop_codon:yes gene_type:complete